MSDQPTNKQENPRETDGSTAYKPVLSSLWGFLKIRPSYRPFIIACCWIVAVPCLWILGLAVWRFIAVGSALTYRTGIVLAILLADWNVASHVLDLYVKEEQEKLNVKLTDVKQREASIEEDLEAQDSTGLISLVRYSRVQLESYYTIGLNQTQKSFRYSIVAMWIGFIILSCGLVTTVIPAESLKIKPADVKVVSLTGGAIVEFISALFLWVYRQSIAHFTYFYNRQMYLHNMLFCFRIAETMSEKKDDAKRLIVEKMVGASWSLENTELPSSKGFRELVSAGKQGKPEAKQKPLE